MLDAAFRGPYNKTDVCVCVRACVHVCAYIYDYNHNSDCMTAV